MLASGKARITEPLGRAILTLAAMQVSRTDDDVPDIQARAQLVTTPIYALHDLPANAVITDPGPPLPAGRLSRGDHRPARLLRTGITATKQPDDDTAVNRSNGGYHPLTAAWRTKVTNEELLKALITLQLSSDEILAELARQDRATKYTDRNLPTLTQRWIRSLDSSSSRPPTPAGGSSTLAVSTHLRIPTEDTIPLNAVRRTIVNNNYTYNLSIAEIIASLEVQGFLD